MSRSSSNDYCPGNSDEIPINPGVDPSTVGDEDTGPVDFTEELQAALNANNFLNEFLEGNTTIDRSTIVDAAICGDCGTYPHDASFATTNNYNQCVLNSILSNSPCRNELDELAEENGLNLTPAQQINLLGPNGSVESCGESNNLVDLVAAELIKDCIDEGLIDYFSQLDIPLTVFQDMCSNTDQISGPPSCDNCTPAQLLIIQSTHQGALTQLDCAINQLESYDGANPQNVKICMETHFGGANSEIMSFFIGGWLQAIRAGLANQEYTIEQTGTEDCDTNVVAHTKKGLILFESFIEITLCDPTHFNTSISEQIATIIHEGAHVFLSSKDVAYIHEPEYSQLNTIQQILNADSFSEISRCICP